MLVSLLIDVGCNVEEITVFIANTVFPFLLHYVFSLPFFRPYFHLLVVVVVLFFLTILRVEF